MRYTPVLALLVTSAAFGGDGTYVNPDVVPNPTPGTGVLLYPGGQYGRVVERDLRQPDEVPAAAQPIKLHPPRHTGADTATATEPVRHKAAALPPPVTAPASSDFAVSRPAPEKTRPVKPAPKVAAAPPPPPVQKSQPSKAAPQKASGGGFDMGDLEVAHQGARSATPARTVQTAKAEPPPRQIAPAVESGGVRRGSIAFERNASDPGGAAVQSLTRLADSLSVALSSGSGRVQVMAYAGPKGERSSDSRRLSLKRALIVRQLLIDAGVPSDKIDVRALGGATDNGSPDRVDIFLK